MQEPSSMVLEQAYKSIPKDGPQLVLDLCGAPGGKSTHLLSLLSADSILVTNEVIRSRARILEENIIKWGAANTLVTQQDPSALAHSRLTFDIVVVDAPCSGEGLFRKDPSAARHWSADHVQHCAARQSRIIKEAQALTAPGGYLIYSTCTYAPEENESHSTLFLAAGWQPVPLAIDAIPGITTITMGGELVGYQCYPHKVRGEGFFISVWQKPGIQAIRNWMTPLPTAMPDHTWPIALEDPKKWAAVTTKDAIVLLPHESSGTLQHLSRLLRPIYYGITAFTKKAGLLIPAHGLAMSAAFHPHTPTIRLSEDEALRYLSRDNLSLEAAKGWQLVSYDEIALGWIKGVGNRVNNYYPQHWRIMNRDKLS